MMNHFFARLLRLSPALVLWSCAAPKAIVVEQPAAPKKESVEEPELTGTAETAIPSLPDDGLRLPDMVTMPGDDEFRATNPSVPSPGAGTVTARPPTDPPPRPKATDDE